MSKSHFKIRIISMLFIATTYNPSHQQQPELNQLFRRPQNPDNNLTTDVRHYPDSYFLDFLKKHESNAKQHIQQQHQVSSEESQVQLKKILTEERLDKMENRMLGEIRKINLKLMRLEDNLRNLTSKIEDLIKVEMSSMKEDVMRALRRDNSNRN